MQRTTDWRESLYPTGSPRTKRITAEFVDPELEAAFAHDHFEVSVRDYTRFAMTLCAAAFATYGLHDAWVIPSIAREAWAIRYGVTVPIAGPLLYLLHSRLYERWQQLTMLGIGTTFNFVVLWIAAIAPPAGFFIYSSYAVLFVTLGPFIGRMNVTTQAIYTALTMAVFNAFDATLTHSPLAIKFSVNLTLFALGGIGALAARQNEVEARRSFLQRRTIDAQMKLLEAEKCTSDSLLLNVLPAKIAERLKHDETAIADGFAEVTVLFADIVGFTAMASRLTARETVQRLNEVFSAFDELASELGLEKIKTIGDAYMVACGLPSHRQDHAEAIADMGLRMLTVAASFGDRFGEPMSFRVGIDSGPVVAGVIGKHKFIYDVWGDTVNTASRMESHGVPDMIQVTERAKERLEHAFEFEERGEIEVKGKGRMRTFFLLRRR
jgi:class 3 adenylate cyclase